MGVNIKDGVVIERRGEAVVVLVVPILFLSQVMVNFSDSYSQRHCIFFHLLNSRSTRQLDSYFPLAQSCLGVSGIDSRPQS